MEVLSNWGLKCDKCEKRMYSEYTTLEYLKQCARDRYWIVDDNKDICLCPSCKRKTKESKSKNVKKR